VLHGPGHGRPGGNRPPTGSRSAGAWRRFSPADPEKHSSVLFDTVAVYLAFSTAHLAMKRMNVRVDDRGYTIEDASARPFDVAPDWHDLDAYLDFLVERMLAPLVAAR
jgi:hypothetical protein